MDAQSKKRARLRRRRRHIRKTVRGTATRPRLSVYRSLANIYTQIIDDLEGKTLVAVSSKTPEVKESCTYGGNVEAAKAVGALLAQRAKEQGIDKVVFDRGGRKYHGRVKALAEAAREAGLDF